MSVLKSDVIVIGAGLSGKLHCNVFNAQIFRNVCMADDIFSSLASFCYPERDRKCLLPITSLTRALITEKPTVTNIRDCVYFIKGSGRDLWLLLIL